MIAYNSKFVYIYNISKKHAGDSFHTERLPHNPILCPYDGSLDNLARYYALANVVEVENFHIYLMTGKLDEMALDYLDDTGFDEV